MSLPRAVRSRPPAARGRWTLDTGAFEKLLAVLGPEREAAGKRYETLRCGLVRLFEWRGCRGPEMLADTTIDRVCRRIDQGKEIDPARAEAYFHGVARNVLLEYFKGEARHEDLRVSLPSELPNPLESLLEQREEQRRLRCLGQCRQAIAQPDWQLVVEYYSSGAAVAGPARSEMASRHGISAGNLRVRVFRIRRQLRACLQACLSSRTRSGWRMGRGKRG